MTLPDAATRRWLGLLILVLWAASLLLPVFTTCRPGFYHVEGYWLLLLGYYGLSVNEPGWIANLFMVAIGGVLVLGRRPWMWLGILCAAFTASAWWFTDWYSYDSVLPICHYHTGYWLWLVVGFTAAGIPVWFWLTMRSAKAA
jgi:hypothetical protein